MASDRVQGAIVRWLKADRELVDMLTGELTTEDRLAIAGEILASSSFHMRALSRAMTGAGALSEKQQQWFVEHCLEVLRNIGVDVRAMTVSKEEAN